MNTTSELTVARRAMACEFTLQFPGGTRRAVDAGCAALEEVERLERKLSVFLDDSEITRINEEAAARAVALDEETWDLLRFCWTLNRATRGAFDVASGSLLRAWGFQGGGRRVPGETERRAALRASGMAHVALDEGARTVEFRRRGIQLNFGAVGKGYAIDCAVRLLRERFGIRAAFVQGGQSSLRAIGTPPGERHGWKVDLLDPCGSGRALARVHLEDRALGTSGTSNQFFVDERGRHFGHILDPRTGWPASGLAGVSVLARTAAEADALSTAFFVLGADAAREFCRRHRGIGAVLLHPDQHGGAPRIERVGAPEVEILR